MNIIRIVHLSDLHFTKKKSLEVWRQVCEFINGTVKPHLVLVTGDVTDNATHDEFETAVGELARINAHPDREGDPLVYRIVAGNHDRFALLGNTFFGLGNSSYAKDKKGRFSESFKTHLVSANAPFDFEIPKADPSWRLRVIGIDQTMRSSGLPRVMSRNRQLPMPRKTLGVVTIGTW